MILLNDPSTFYVEKHTYEYGDKSLDIKNNLTNKVYSVSTNIEEMKNYYKVVLSEELPEGEYTYSIKVGSTEVENGLLYYGDFDKQKIEHETQNTIYVYE